MSKPNLPETLGTMIRALEARLRRLEQGQRFQLPILSGAPANPRDGDAWIDSTTNTVKVRVNGVTKTFTIT